MHTVLPENLLVTTSANEPLRREDFHQLECVFGLMPNVIVYVKDRTRLWVACNSFALTFLNRQSHEEILGTCEDDFFPKKIAESIREDDLRVINKGERIIERLELVANERGQIVWVKTSKLPIVNQTGDILGLVGVTTVLDMDASLPPKCERFRKVVDKIDRQLESPLRVGDLATIANMSESHFRRSFKQSFGIAPQEFILQQRLRRAAVLLTDTDRTVSKISLDCGFGDQSHFCRQFARFFGDSPSSYRRK